jgi:hypothetical protein
VRRSNFIGRHLVSLRLDFPQMSVGPIRLVLATVVAIAGSLAADALLVAIGTATFPHTKGYEHFAFVDYAKLTIIGVVIACLAWPAVVWMSSHPRWLFSRLAVLVTLVLLLPDVWLVLKHQPGQAVVVLVIMHLVIAVVTYAALVLIAPARLDRRTSVRRASI